MAVELPPRLNPLGLSALDIAGCRPWGHTGEVVPRPEGPAPSPREALEEALLAALEAGPCVVAFSGGRDSSALLALAVHVARREGLEPPGTVTVAFDGSPLSDETEWQRDVLAHLALEPGERIDGGGGRMDFVGPVAQETLRRHGLLHPHHSHMYAPMIERSAGATLIIGFGGDELFDLWRLTRAAAALRGRRPRRYDLVQLGLATLPAPLRRPALERGTAVRAPWLTAAAERAYLRARAHELAAEPAAFGARTRWWSGRRGVVLARRSMDLLGQAAGTHLSYPLLDPPFLSAVDARYGRLGPGGRTQAFHETFGDLLPAHVVERRSKAAFTDVWWTGHSSDFARGWDGRGVDPALVDARRLREAWAGEGWRCAQLMQALWLAREASG